MAKTDESDESSPRLIIPFKHLQKQHQDKMIICGTPESKKTNDRPDTQSPFSQAGDSMGRVTPQLLLDNFRDAIKQKRLRTPPSKTNRLASPTSATFSHFSSYIASRHGLTLRTQNDRKPTEHQIEGKSSFNQNFQRNLYDQQLSTV